MAFDGLFFVYNFIFCEKGSAFWKAEIRGEGKHSELRRPFPLPTPLPSGHAVVRRCGGCKCTDGVQDSGVLVVEKGCEDSVALICWLVDGKAARLRACSLGDEKYFLMGCNILGWCGVYRV